MTARRSAGRRTGATIGIAVAIAAATLLLPATLSFDPWAWLVWGREVASVDLATTGGPSWKPLPVAVTALFAPAGEAAEHLWMVTVRAAAILSLFGAFRLARRFGGPVAGAVAAGLLVLTPDPDPRLLRLVGEGHADVLLLPAALFAIGFVLDGRLGPALALVTAAAWGRPEAWPFLAALAWWTWSRDPRLRPWVAAAVASVPVVWFGGDWWGSGSPWHGADVAQVDLAVPWPLRLRAALGVVAGMVVVPAWVTAAVAATTDGPHRPRLRTMAVGAAAWCAVVVGMALVLGYAALSRFVLPAAGVVCVLAGVGAAHLVDRLRGRVVLSAVVLVAALAAAAPVAAGIPDVLDRMQTRRALDDHLDDLLDDLGRDRLLSCGTLAAESTFLRPAVAWKLDLPLDDVEVAPFDGPSVAIVRTGGRIEARLARRVDDILATNDGWVALAVDCPSAVPDP